jgi:3-hydroxyacyl-CoA dehydrogenase
MGRYGQKTGAGWYRYEAGSRTPVIDPLIEELAAKAARQRGIRRRRTDGPEIARRVLTAVANEGARVLGEGMARGPADIDVIWVNGFGFPRHRGGPMAWADETGPRRLLAAVEEYRAHFGDYWQPAPLLERLAASGGNFYGGAVRTTGGS